jgi:hypothetical protein
MQQPGEYPRKCFKQTVFLIGGAEEFGRGKKQHILTHKKIGLLRQLGGFKLLKRLK